MVFGMYKNTWQKACVWITHSTTTLLGCRVFRVCVAVCFVVLNKIKRFPAGFDVLICIRTLLGAHCV